MKCNRNIYQLARERAGMTQEAVSEHLYISTESLRMYESGRRRPSDEMVVLMADLYHDKALVYYHLKSSPAGDVLPHVTERSLQECAMQLFRLLRKFAKEERVETLLEIAEDGIIDDLERPIYHDIMDELREIVATSLSLSLAQGQEKRLTSGQTGKAQK